MNCKCFCKQSNAQKKICFVLSTGGIVLSTYFFSLYPALLLYSFSVLLAICMVFRAYTYWRENYILFMLDMCYFVNALSVAFVWGFPQSQKVQYIQFGLANAHAYCGAFLFRNALVLHDLQKMISSFIHVLPVLFSFLIRWFPKETSILWYTPFVNSECNVDLKVWHSDVDWIWVMLVPMFLFALREVLYYLIIYGCVKPNDKYLDSYRYLHKKKYITHLLWDRLEPQWHLPIWVILNIVLSACVLFLAIFAWSSFLFHSSMIMVQLLTIAWNGACYYVDIYPFENGPENRQLHASTIKTDPLKPAVCDPEVNDNVSVKDLGQGKWPSSELSGIPNHSSVLLPTDLVLEVPPPNGTIIS